MKQKLKKALTQAQSFQMLQQTVTSHLIDTIILDESDKQPDFYDRLSDLVTELRTAEQLGDVPYGNWLALLKVQTGLLLTDTITICQALSDTGYLGASQKFMCAMVDLNTAINNLSTLK